MTADNILRDALTGAHSRATLQDRLGEEVERARRYCVPLLLLVVDTDQFKSIDDAFGHARGHLVLIAFVERLSGLAGCSTASARSPFRAIACYPFP